MILLSLMIMGSVICNKYYLHDKGSSFCNTLVLNKKCEDLKLMYYLFKLLFMAAPYVLLNPCFISTNICVATFCGLLSFQFFNEFNHIFRSYIIYILVYLLFCFFIGYNIQLEMKLSFLYRAEINQQMKDQARVLDTISDGVIIHCKEHPKDRKNGRASDQTATSRNMQIKYINSKLKKYFNFDQVNQN